MKAALVEIAKCMFGGAVGIVLYTYVGYPLWMYLRSRLQPNPWLREPILPSVTVIVAVHNGGAMVGSRIDQLLAINYPEDRINLIVVSDGSTDETNLILERVRHPRVTAITLREHRGKAVALNAGIKNASGEILLFVDVRPTLDANAVRLLLSNFADPRVGCATGELILRQEGHDPTMKVVMGGYWRYEQWIRESEAMVDSPVGVYGGFYAARRELIEFLPEGTINDDMLQAFNVVRQGYRVVYDSRAFVYDTWPKTPREEFNRKVRTLAGNCQLLKLAPWILTTKNRIRVSLISHKLLRLLVPILLPIILITTALLAPLSPLFQVFLIIQITMYCLAVCGAARRVSILDCVIGPAHAFCMLNAAAAVGFYKFMFSRGPLWTIWTQQSVQPGLPPEKSRKGIAR